MPVLIWLEKLDDRLKLQGMRSLLRGVEQQAKDRVKLRFEFITDQAFEAVLGNQITVRV